MLKISMCTLPVCLTFIFGSRFRTDEFISRSDCEDTAAGPASLEDESTQATRPKVPQPEELYYKSKQHNNGRQKMVESASS